MKVKATLITACGCRGEIDTTFPPPPKIMLALKPAIRPGAFIPVGRASDGAPYPIPAAPRMRTFELRDKGHSLISTGWWAEYHEEV